MVLKRTTVVLVPKRNLNWNVRNVARLVTLRGIAVVETRRITQMLVVRERGLRTNPKTKVDTIAWWIDSGATTHVCKDHCWFKTYEPMEEGSVLYMGGDHFTPVHGKGSVVLEFSSVKSITLFNVLYVPKLHKNLISGFSYFNNGIFMLNLNKVPDDSGSVYMSSSNVKNDVKKGKSGEVGKGKGNEEEGEAEEEERWWGGKWGARWSGRRIEAMAVVRLPDQKRKPLGEKGIDCIFFGYAEHSKEYRYGYSSIAEGDLRKFSDIGAWYAIEDCAQYDKKCSNLTSVISDETIANPNAQIVWDDMVRVQVPRCMAWLDYDEHVDSLSTMDNEVGVTRPESTIQTLPSFEEYTPPVTYPEEVEKTLETPIEVEPLNETKLEEISLNYNHNTPLSSREVPSFDRPEPQPLFNSPSLDVSLGDVIGPQPPIKPHSPDSSRMKEVYPLREELSLFDRPNEVERGRILEAHRLESILQQQISQRTALSHHDDSLISLSRCVILPMILALCLVCALECSDCAEAELVIASLVGSLRGVGGTVVKLSVWLALLNGYSSGVIRVGWGGVCEWGAREVDAKSRAYAEEERREECVRESVEGSGVMWMVKGRKAHLLEDKQIPSVGVFDEVYSTFGRHLEEIHVTWAHLEKKQTRLRTNTKTLEDLCSQSLKTASPTLHDAITTHSVMASQHFITALVRTDSHADLEDFTHDGVTIKTRRRHSNKHKVCKMVKSLYGLKQALKQWHQKFDKVVLSSGFLLNQLDKCVYSKFDGTGNGVIICLYVDDMLIFGTDQNQVDKTEKFLSSKFSMKDMGEVDVIVGIKIKHENKGIVITQSPYIEKILKKFNREDCSAVSTPMDPVKKLNPNTGKLVDQLEYSRVIGCLMYAMTSTRPDIAYAVGRLSRFISNPSRQHWHAITRVFKYMKDASRINHVEDSSSTSGWVFLLGGGAIALAFKKQTCITDSTMKYEFVALTTAGKEAKWLRNLIHEILI
ncbi:zinc finger, CCHC-type containing protein [Tanacetum coccineum]